jgi:hypothetical protein
MVKIFVSQNFDDFGISTDAMTEPTFVRQASQALLEALESDKSPPNKHWLIANLLMNSVNICAKMRGYKSEVEERRWLYAGEHSPLPDETALAQANDENGASKQNSEFPSDGEGAKS